ncbi:MAG: DUF998 domain-containing protein [Thermoplasmata archaeon]|nr:MAG: DUF998 domain-containing protein [Thermoplasmata archaeon]
MQQKAETQIFILLLISALMLCVAPFFLEDSYNWIKHTTSESGAQLATGSWCARIGFMLYGLSIFCIGTKGSLMWFQKFPFLFFGISMLSVAVFSNKPWIEGVPYNNAEDVLHSIGSSVVGIAFIANVIVISMSRTHHNSKTITFDLLAIIASLIIPLSMVFLTDYRGILQRAMFAVSYIWYGYYLLGMPNLRKKCHLTKESS